MTNRIGLAGITVTLCALLNSGCTSSLPVRTIESGIHQSSSGLNTGEYTFYVDVIGDAAVGEQVTPITIPLNGTLAVLETGEVSLSVTGLNPAFEKARIGAACTKKIEPIESGIVTLFRIDCPSVRLQLNQQAGEIVSGTMSALVPQHRGTRNGACIRYRSGQGAPRCELYERVPVFHSQWSSNQAISLARAL